MKFTNTETWGFEHALRGMRNPLESWKKSDSFLCDTQHPQQCETCEGYNDPQRCTEICNGYIIGPNDMDLAKRLIAGGAEHRKFLRQIFVSVDITAPLYWWKEFDTYKIGTVANSTSTMHKLVSKPITLDCFETDDLDQAAMLFPYEAMDKTVKADLHMLLNFLEKLRKRYVETQDKRIWKELVRWLPEGWLQTRTVTLTYENLRTIYHQRKDHKLNEWSGKDDATKPNFIAWIKTLPYAEELIIN